MNFVKKYPIRTKVEVNGKIWSSPVLTTLIEITQYVVMLKKNHIYETSTNI